MFARLKKSGRWQYLQILENSRQGRKVIQKVIANLGRVDQINTTSLIRSLSRFSTEPILFLSDRSKLELNWVGPSLIFEKIWQELGLPELVRKMSLGFEAPYDLERAIFFFVINSLFFPGADEGLSRRTYTIENIEKLSSHHIVGALSFMGEKPGEKGADRDKVFCRFDVLQKEARRRSSSAATFNIFLLDFRHILPEEATQGSEKNSLILAFAISDDGEPLLLQLLAAKTVNSESLALFAGETIRRFPDRKFGCFVADKSILDDGLLDRISKSNALILRKGLQELHPLYRETILRDRSNLKTSKFRIGASAELMEFNIAGERFVFCFDEEGANARIKTKLASPDAFRTKGLAGESTRFKELKKLDEELHKDRVEEIIRKEESKCMWFFENRAGWSLEKVSGVYKKLWFAERLFRQARFLLQTLSFANETEPASKGALFCAYLGLLLLHELRLRVEEAGFSFEWSGLSSEISAIHQVVFEQGGELVAHCSRPTALLDKILRAIGIEFFPAVFGKGDESDL